MAEPTLNDVQSYMIMLFLTDPDRFWQTWIDLLDYAGSFLQEYAQCDPAG